MIEGLRRLDALSPAEAEAELRSCCGSRRWARAMAEARPFATLEEILTAADRAFGLLAESDWLEAFAAHPRIGDRGARGVARWEQAAAFSASASVLEALDRANREYESRFGYIFIVRAAGKSAAEMLALCRERLHNDPKAELRVAAEEQKKIARLRLEKLARQC